MINICFLFVQDLKLGHYFKVPPRTLFLVQSISSIYSSCLEWNTFDLRVEQRRILFVWRPKDIRFRSSQVLCIAVLLWQNFVFSRLVCCRMSSLLVVLFTSLLDVTSFRRLPWLPVHTRSISRICRSAVLWSGGVAWNGFSVRKYQEVSKREWSTVIPYSFQFAIPCNIRSGSINR